MKCYYKHLIFIKSAYNKWVHKPDNLIRLKLLILYVKQTLLDDVLRPKQVKTINLIKYIWN